MTMRPVLVGDPAPLFVQHCTTQWGRYSFDMAAGRYSILLFVPSLHNPAARRAYDHVRRGMDALDTAQSHVFIVSADEKDRAAHTPDADMPGLLFLWDADLLVHNLYGVAAKSCCWVVVDPMMRIALVAENGPQAARRVLEWTRAQPPHQDGPIPALLLPNVLEPEFCNALIHYYQTQETHLSAVLTQGRDGSPLNVTDLSFKRRRDCTLRDAYLVQQLQARIIRRVVPEITKSFQCTVTQMDRMIISCYDGADRGCFGPHRDNTVAGAAHRLFAISINLNDAFEGGDLIFPEFSARGFRPPAGGAVIFSCALLHAVRPVTAGRRYACLPFAFNAESLARARQAHAQAADTK